MLAFATHQYHVKESLALCFLHVVFLICFPLLSLWILTFAPLHCHFFPLAIHFTIHPWLFTFFKKMVLPSVSLDAVYSDFDSFSTPEILIGNPPLGVSAAPDLDLKISDDEKLTSPFCESPLLAGLHFLIYNCLTESKFAPGHMGCLFLFKIRTQTLEDRYHYPQFLFPWLSLLNWYFSWGHAHWRANHKDAS